MWRIHALLSPVSPACSVVHRPAHVAAIILTPCPYAPITGLLTYRLRRALINYHFSGFYMALRFIVTQPASSLWFRVLGLFNVGRAPLSTASTLLFTFGTDEVVHLVLRTTLSPGVSALQGNPVFKPGLKPVLKPVLKATGKGKDGAGAGGTRDTEESPCDTDVHEGDYEYECVICQQSEEEPLDATLQHDRGVQPSLCNYCTRVPFHVAHPDCMLLWFNAGQAGSHACPMCRAPLRTHVNSMAQRLTMCVCDSRYYHGVVSRVCINIMSLLATVAVLKLLTWSQVAAARARACALPRVWLALGLRAPTAIAAGVN